MKGCLLDQEICCIKKVQMQPNILSLARHFPVGALFSSDRWYLGGVIPVRVWVNINPNPDDCVTIIDSAERVVARGNVFICGYDEHREWMDLPEDAYRAIEYCCETVIQNNQYSNKAYNHLLLSDVTRVPEYIPTMWRHIDE